MMRNGHVVLVHVVIVCVIPILKTFLLQLGELDKSD